MILLNKRKWGKSIAFAIICLGVIATSRRSAQAEGPDGASLDGLSQPHSRKLFGWIDSDECESEFEKIGGGALACVIYICSLIYVFLILAVVVDKYFVRAIEVILCKLQISDDMAGAIFMAAGTSAAELFSNLVDTFVYQSNIGFGVIYGTVVFNIFAGVGYAAYICPSDVKKCDWRVMIRDTTWYLVSIVFVVAFIWDRKVEWWESFILVLLYAGYVASVLFQDALEDLICAREPDEKRDLTIQGMPKGAVELEEKENHDGAQIGDSEDNQTSKEDVKVEVESREGGGEELGPIASCCYGFFKCLVAPIEFLFYWTIPDSGTPENPTWKYMYAFFVACIYIAMLSWLMVKFATGIGCIIGVGPVLLGTAFLAVGTSIPDSMSTVIAAKKGQGPLAVSNTLGSNIFDMQIAIGFPWLLYSLVYAKPFEINHGNMAGPIVFLLASALSLHFGLSFFGWKLRKRLGVVLMCCYVVFIIYVFCEEFAM